MRLFEIENKKTIAIMAGGFHPFHSGHAALYNSIVDAMPYADVYVSATDTKTTRPFPFKYKQFLATISGVPEDRFLQVKRTYNVDEYMQLTDDPSNTVLVFVRSEKDRDEHPKPGDPNAVVTRGPRKGMPPYILSYEDFQDDLQSMDKHAYIKYMPTVDFGVGDQTVKSATEIRNMWPTASETEKESIIDNLYPSATKEQKKTAMSMFNEILGEE